MQIKDRLFKQSIIISWLSIGLLLFFIGGASLLFVNSLLKKDVQERLDLILNLKQQELENYFKSLSQQTLSYSKDLTLVQAMSEFSKAYASYQSELAEIGPNTLLKYRSAVVRYMRDFKAEFTKQYGASVNFNPQDLLNLLKEDSFALQYYYILENPYPVGKKHALVFSDDDTSYSLVHRRYHQYLKDLQKDFGYHDLMLVDSETGTVVYSVEKELDFVTSLKDGPYANTNAAEVYRKVLQSNRVVLSDFEPYVPSYGVQAAFMGAPIYNLSGKRTGVLIMQLPVDKINAIVNQDRESKDIGLSDTGGIYILGSDFYTRNISRQAMENWEPYFLKLKNLNYKPDILKILENKKNDFGLIRFNNPILEQAMQGDYGAGITEDYLGNPSFMSAAPLNISGVHWIIAVALSTEEALLERTKLMWWIGLFSLVFFIFSTFVTAYVSRNSARTLSLPIENLAKVLEEVASSRDLTQRIKISNADTEIQSMVNALNHMLQSLEKAFNETMHSVAQMRSSVDHVFQVAQDMENIENNEEALNQNQQGQSAKKLMDATASLNNLSDKLKDLANQFNIHEERADKMSDW
ncbi:MAG: HAMP domain-containing protein [Gammaproteobacteria bacterium]